MRFPSMGPQTVIKWGRRTLYLVLFISFLVVFGNFDKPYTYTFLGSIIALIIPLLFSLRDEDLEEEDDLLERANDSSIAGSYDLE